MPTSAPSRLRALVDRYVLHADAPPEDRRAFEEFAHASLTRVVAGMALLLSATILLLWPLDRLIFAGSPEIVRTFDTWRPETCALVLAAGLGIRYVSLLGRGAYWVLLAVGALSLFRAAVLFAHLGGLAGPFLHLSYNFEFMLVPMLLSLPRRVAGALVLHAAFVAGVLWVAPGEAAGPYFVFFIVAGFLVDLANVIFGQIVYHLAWRNFLQRRAIEQQAVRLREANDKSERLLLNILPGPIADRLKEEPAAIADRFGEVTVLFADICEFTPLSESLPPEGLVELLNRIFTEFDALVERHGLEKIKTIGDAYMVAGGLPRPRADHAEAVAELALDMARAAAGFTAPNGRPVRMRIGVHSGPVVAGVIGSKKFSYDLWGDTVNTASRMESHGVVGGITVSQATRERLGERYRFEDRGLLHVKGKGEMHLFLLQGRAEAAARTGSS